MAKISRERLIELRTNVLGYGLSPAEEGDFVAALTELIGARWDENRQQRYEAMHAPICSCNLEHEPDAKEHASYCQMSTLQTEASK